MVPTRSITREQLDALNQRARSLIEEVIRSTEFSPLAAVRVEGQHFGEVIQEWMDDLERMYVQGDPCIEEQVKSFAVRLAKAEQKVGGWWKPPRSHVRAVGTRRKKSAQSAA